MPTISNLEQIYFAALEKVTPAERSAYLDEACAGDVELRQHLEKMLAAAPRAAAFLETPPSGLHVDSTQFEAMPSQIGAEIGPYKIREQIGEGGMGTVYLAEQTEPVRRKVALKVIKPGMDSRQILARFDAERQALSLMDHPNIARVLDAGVIQAGEDRLEAGGRRPEEKVGRFDITEDLPAAIHEPAASSPKPSDFSLRVPVSSPQSPASGLQPAVPSLQPPVSSLQPNVRPYFVMELVKGVPITEYCDEHKLTPRERLELFLPVCHAIQHAHQKGIIHRDIKPSNVLVAEYDERPVPKVIDFGVAKALNQPLTEQSLYTGLGTIIGTLEYMSPEQAKVNELDVDTRSDVYSLGVLLYELLTGSTPFDRQRLRSAALDEMLRIIREEEPPRPSTKLSSSETLASIAANRRTEPARLSTLVRGELDWIVMKALEKERNRRYETVNALAMDIQRYLAGETVLACPPSRVYRLRKFVGNHKLGVVMTLGLSIMLLLSLFGAVVSNLLISAESTKTALALKSANEQRDRALAAELESNRLASDLEDQANDLKSQAKTLGQIASFQANVLQQLDVSEAGRLLTANIESALDDVWAKQGISGEDRAKRSEQFRETWQSLNSTDLMRQTFDEALLEPALRNIEQQFANERLIDARLREGLSRTYARLGYYDRAIDQQTLAIDSLKASLPENDTAVISAISYLGNLYTNTGNLRKAEDSVKLALDLYCKTGNEASVGFASSCNNLANLLYAQGHTAEAELHSRRALELYRDLNGDADIDTLAAMNNLGQILVSLGRYREAEPLLLEAMDKRKRLLGDGHPAILSSLNNVGSLFAEIGKFDRAETYFRDLYAASLKANGERHGMSVVALNQLGGSLMAQGRFNDALPLIEKAKIYSREVLGREHRDTLKTINSYAVLLQRLGRVAEAESQFRELLELRRIAYGNEHPDTLIAIMNLGGTLQQLGRYAESEPFQLEAATLSRKLHGDHHDVTLRALSRYGSLLLSLGRPADAEPYLVEALSTSQKSLGPTHPTTLSITRQFGKYLECKAEYKEAERYFRMAMKGSRQVLGNRHLDTLNAVDNLGMALGALRQFDEAEQLLREATEVKQRELGEKHPDTITSMNNLGSLLLEMGRVQESEQWLTASVSSTNALLGKTHPISVRYSIELGRLYHAQSKHDETIELLTTLIEPAREAFVEQNSWRLARLLKTLAHSHIALGNFTGGEIHFLEAADILTRVRGATSAETKDCIFAIIEMYSKWNTTQPGMGFDLKMAEWENKLRSIDSNKDVLHADEGQDLHLQQLDKDKSGKQ